jgi:hypothetical protein
MSASRIASAKMVKPKPPAPEGGGRRTALLVSLALVAVVAVVAAAGWLVWSAFNRPLAAASDTGELIALSDRLTAIENTITPIASTFTSRPATALIDVSAYRDRIASAQKLVDSTNDITVTSANAIEVRDLIITGGSQVLTGFTMALDALQSNDASATDPAATEVDAGLAALQQARDKLDTLLGKKSST